MLSFKDLSERKTKVKINTKQSEITEKNGTCAKDRVKADIAAKYGKGAIMDTKKKK